MSAITPFLEHQADPAETEVQRETLDLPAEASQAAGTVEDATGLGKLETVQAAQSEPPTVWDPGDVSVAALSQSHAGLLTTAWIRASVERALVGNSYHVEASGNEVYLVLQHPIAVPRQSNDDRFPVAPWSPPVSPTAKRFSVLSWTSKMGAPSFSLPAGPVVAGGACPGANAGQSIVPIQTLRAAARSVAEVIGKPVRLQQAICQYCYAEGGQYSTGQVQFAQVLRFIWCRDALRTGDGEQLWSPFQGNDPPPQTLAWLEAMAYAIDHADYELDGGKVGKIDYPAERHPGRYFRIHDSGDFWGPGYLWLWKQLANRFPDITFWAPSRYWAVSAKAIDHVNQINSPSANLIIRPSAYHVNEAPPRDLGPGWATGSTAFALDEKEAGYAKGDFSWDCQTYAVDDEKHTCRHATAPGGKVGCRACWIHPEREPNYTLH